MSLNRAPTGAPPLSQNDLPDEAILWLHAGFCELGLPIRPARGAWHRSFGAASLRIEPPSAEQSVPNGRMARLALMHICDTAHRANSVTVDLGGSAAPAAERLGIASKSLDLIEQMHRLLSAKVSVALADGQEIPVFDARSRSRGESSEWRQTIRLGSKFLASLAQHAVTLDLRIVRQLADSPLALDAYAWIRLLLATGRGDGEKPLGWDELLARFGAPSQGAEAFRSSFEAALRAVFEADSSIALAVDDEGMRVRLAGPEDEPPAEAAPEPPAVAEAPPVVAAPPAAAPPPAPSPAPAPAPAPPPASPPPAEPAPTPAGERITQDSICLSRQATGLSHGLWLRRGHGEERVLVGVTPGNRLETDRLTVLAVEPMVLQVSGGLHQAEFDRVSAWIMVNRDLIDDFWEGRIATFDEVNRRVRKAPAPGWR